jgi:hypothetical protein
LRNYRWLAIVVLIAGAAWADGPEAVPLVRGSEHGRLLHRLAMFVHWPAEAQRRADLLVVGLAGSDPLERVVSEWGEGTLPDGRRVTFRRVQRVAEMRQCHVLFIGRSLTRQVPAILLSLDNATVLTVGAIPGFGHMGGMVELPDRPEARRRFHLNPLAARRAGLAFHVGLLTVSTVVHPLGEAE